MLTDFAAIDFEIANHYHSSVCSIGIVIVRAGVVVEKCTASFAQNPNGG